MTIDEELRTLERSHQRALKANAARLHAITGAIAHDGEDQQLADRVVERHAILMEAVRDLVATSASVRAIRECARVVGECAAD